MTKILSYYVLQLKTVHISEIESIEGNGTQELEV